MKLTTLSLIIFGALAATAAQAATKAKPKTGTKATAAPTTSIASHDLEAPGAQDKMAIALTFAQCWTPEYDEPAVTLYMLMGKDSSIAFIDVVNAEKKRYLTDSVYRQSADRAIASIKQCSALRGLQSYPYEMWQEMELTFDPKIIGKHHSATPEEKAALSSIVASCWKNVTDAYPIKLSLKMENDATVQSIHVQESEKELYRSVAAYKQAADSAIDIFKSCPSLQEFRKYPYEIWKELDIAFTPPSAQYYNVDLSIIPQTGK